MKEVEEDMRGHLLKFINFGKAHTIFIERPFNDVTTNEFSYAQSQYNKVENDIFIQLIERGKQNGKEKQTS